VKTNAKWLSKSYCHPLGKVSLRNMDRNGKLNRRTDAARIEKNLREYLGLLEKRKEGSAAGRWTRCSSKARDLPAFLEGSL